MIKKILIANRGEIAVRIAKACREIGITSSAVYSDADDYSLHVRVSDEAHSIGGVSATESYLNIDKIVTKAKEIGADAIHPGYGFLSENPAFIKRVEEEGIIFIGPSSDSVRLMGSKTEARRLMDENNVPIVPGTTNPIEDIEEAKKTASGIGFPVMLKAAAGGGGKGMRKVYSPDEFEPAFERAKNEALKSFGDDSVYIEKLIENPKHIEVQILGDKQGNYIHLFERECSVQRRHQKVIEESPSFFVDEATREKITSAAINAAKACNYWNAGTIEFLMDRNKNFYFLEMNTRLQVEHPVTEMITGIDLVKEQIRIAEGEMLGIDESRIAINGHAIECRIYAEDVDNNFAPSTGKIIRHRLPSGPGIRVDRGVDLFSDVSIYYDPLLSKVMAWGRDRNEAIERMKRALGEYHISGVITNIPALLWMLNRKEFQDGSFDINFLDEKFLPLIPDRWKIEDDDQYENAVYILSSLLKYKENELSPVQIKCSPNNKWNDKLSE